MCRCDRCGNGDVIQTFDSTTTTQGYFEVGGDRVRFWRGRMRKWGIGDPKSLSTVLRYYLTLSILVCRVQLWQQFTSLGRVRWRQWDDLTTPSLYLYDYSRRFVQRRGIYYNILFEDLYCSFGCATYWIFYSTILPISRLHRFFIATTLSHITGRVGGRECEEDPFLLGLWVGLDCVPYSARA